MDGEIAGLTGYLYFGGPALPAQSDGCGIMSAVSSYRIPRIIEIIGTDRSKPYTHRETHMAWSGARKTTFVNDGLAVYSQYDGNGSLFWSDQMHRAGVVWSSDHLGAQFVVKHPKSGLIGETPANQVLQHRGVLLGVAKESMTGYVPLAAALVECREENGWLYLNTGSAYIAFSCKGGFSWGANVTLDGVGAQYLKYDHSNYSVNYRTLSLNGGAKNGWVIQTAASRDFPTFTAFVDKVKGSGRVDFAGVDNADPQVKYTTIDGDNLEITYDGTGGGSGTGRRKVNGVPLNYGAWPRSENPWMKSDVGGSRLTMTLGGYTRTYDFTNWTISETGTLDAVMARPVAAARPGRAWSARPMGDAFTLTGRAGAKPVTAPGVVIRRAADGSCIRALSRR
jgi:hypothetical protein